MKVLPVCIFTRNRTSCALATVGALLDNLKCTGRDIRYILCDDRSEPGHVAAIVDRFNRSGVNPIVHLNDEKRHGLGASMNKGLESAFGMSHECLRIEDDWLLKRELDLGEWADCMDKLSIGSLRLGMMFRKPWELKGYEKGLLQVRSDPSRIFTFNNQVALVTDTVYDICGPYVENETPNVVEKTMAISYNNATRKCNASPWVCWPKGWATCKFYDDTMAFDHIGKSTVNHGYKVPAKYNGLNDPVLDRKIRAGFIP